MADRMDQHVLRQHGAVDDTGPVGGADRDKQPPPHPCPVPRIDAAPERGPHVRKADETIERADHVPLPLGSGPRILEAL